MIFFVIGEILIVSFQNPEIGGELIGLPTVFSKKDAVLILDKELPRIPWLPAQFGDDGCNTDVHIRYVVQELTEFTQIIGIPAHMLSLIHISEPTRRTPIS